MPSGSSLFIEILAGACGVAYFLYGKRQVKFTPMVSGVLLCIYPYFVEGTLWLSVVGLLLLAAPFVIEY
jgi:hypothetical protein